MGSRAWEAGLAPSLVSGLSVLWLPSIPGRAGTRPDVSHGS